MTRTIRTYLLLLTAVVGMVLAGIAAPGQAGATGTAVVGHTVATGGGEVPPSSNDLFPEDRDVSDCIGTLERPDCGSERRGDLQLYLTFAALTLGIGVITWRVARLVKRRDENQPTPTNTF